MEGGLLDEVRFSNVARTDFSAVIAGTAYIPDASTIALYHLDETTISWTKRARTTSA